MASFDIKDLYTNIPLEETIEICLSLLHAPLINLPLDLFKKLLELSVYNTMFAFNGKYYKQKDGLGMGLPLSPTVANIFLCYHERKWIQECPAEFRPVFYRRYVDDTFLLFRDPSHPQDFLEYINSQHQNMKFTSEIEQNGQLPFLDCMVERHDNQFVTSVYRKQTYTGLGLNYFSHCPFIYKLNSIRTLINRAYCVTSNFTALNREFSFLVEFFFQNGYPKKVVYKCINNFISKILHPPPIFATVNKKKMFAPMPYAGKHSEKMGDEVISLVNTYFGQIDLTIVFTNKNTIGSLFRFKERLPMGLLSSVIYQFCCAQCASGTYVGSTTRALHMRIAEHMGRSFRTGRVIQSSKSAIRDHAEQGCNSINVKDFKVLGHQKNDVHLRILESLYILRSKPTLNGMQSAFPLRIAS